MQIDQQDCAPLAANPFQLLRQKFVIRAMDTLDPSIHLIAWEGLAPYLAKTGQPPGYKAKATARPTIGTSSRCAHDRLRYRSLAPRAADHVPVNVVMRAIEIEHRPRRVRHQQPGTGSLCYGHRELINMPILQPELAQFLIAQSGKDMAGISAPGMRHSDKHRQWHGTWRDVGECGTEIGGGSLQRDFTTRRLDQIRGGCMIRPLLAGLRIADDVHRSSAALFRFASQKMPHATLADLVRAIKEA